MGLLQFKTKQSAKDYKVFIVCPGLQKNEITVSFDPEEGVMDVAGESNNKELLSIIDVDVKGCVEIPKKFRSEKPQLTIENGIVVISFSLSKGVVIINPVD